MKMEPKQAKDFEFDDGKVIQIIQGFKLSYNPDKRVGTRSKFSPPPTFNVDNQVIFALFVGKTRYFPTLIRGEGGYTIQLKCPNYFWPALSERDMRGIFQ